MNSTFRRGTAALFATTLAMVGTADQSPAQDVLLHEVRADAGGHWIELHNRGAAPADLSTWTLFHASLTPNMPQTYWWPFPTGTVLQPGGYLRVHWFQAAPGTPQPAGELWTGATPWDFLWGLGGETLRGERGAIGLLRSQNSALMSSASVVEDWVVWGQTGFSREFMATGAGVWSQGHYLPPIPAGSSLARNPALVDQVIDADLAWFVDATPTPLASNQTGAVVEPYGTPCTLPGHHLIGQPLLRATSEPLRGSATFSLTVDSTLGLYGEFVAIGFGPSPGFVGMPTILPPYPGAGCAEAIDVTQLVAIVMLPAQIFTTPIPMPLVGLPPAAIGLELHAQALVLDLVADANPPYQGLTNALRLVIGE